MHVLGAIGGHIKTTRKINNNCYYHKTKCFPKKQENTNDEFCVDYIFSEKGNPKILFYLKERYFFDIIITRGGEEDHPSPKSSCSFDFYKSYCKKRKDCLCFECSPILNDNVEQEQEDDRYSSEQEEKEDDHHLFYSSEQEEKEDDHHLFYSSEQEEKEEDDEKQIPITPLPQIPDIPSELQISDGGDSSSSFEFFSSEEDSDEYYNYKKGGRRRNHHQHLSSPPFCNSDINKYVPLSVIIENELKKSGLSINDEEEEKGNEIV